MPNYSASSTPPISGAKSYTFGDWQLFPELGLLLQQGQSVPLTTRAFAVLRILVEAQGELISKDELLEQVWDGLIVEENNLQAQISAIRKALGADRKLISTEFGRGYRFLGKTESTPKMETVASAKKAASNSIHQPATALLGRSVAVAEIRELLSHHRLVTITGIGGTGKTRLAQEIGWQLSQSGGDVRLLEMAREQDSERIWSAIAAALGVEIEYSGVAVEGSSQLSALGGLLIIDNCEHLLEELATVTESLLRISPNITVLATSQEAINIDGERVYRLPPLSVPERSVTDIEVIQSFSSVQLFSERAVAASHDFKADESNVQLISDICRRLDGIPLAIELAAARVAVLGVSQICRGLDDRFRLLTGGRRTALPRHRTLQGTIDWTHSLLDEQEQQFFRQLSVFPDKFSIFSVCLLLGVEEGEQWQIVDLLQSLVARSLLQRDVTDSEAQYWFLENIRYYATEKLLAAGDIEAMNVAHSRYCEQMSQLASADWDVLPTSQWRQKYQYCVNDMHAALNRALSSEGDFEQGIRLLKNMVPFWITFSLYDECQRHLELLFSRHNAEQVVSPYDRMALQAAMGKALTWAKGPVEATGQAWQQALDSGAASGDSEVQLQAHYGLWLYSLRTGVLEQSLNHAMAMTQLAYDCEDDEAYATGQRIEGVSRHFLGQHKDARVLLETSLNWFSHHLPPHPFRFGLDQKAAAQAFLSRLLWVQGEFHSAECLADAAVAQARSLDHICSLCCALAEGQCMTAALNGNVEKVVESAQELIRLSSENGLLFWKAYGELFLLWANTSIGESRINLDVMIDELSRIRLDRQYSTLLVDIALKSERPDLIAVVKKFINTDTGPDGQSHWAMPEFMRVNALALRQQGLESECREMLEKAWALTQQQEAKGWQLRVAIDYVPLMVECGGSDKVRAYKMLSAVIHATEDEHITPDLKAAKQLLSQFELQR